MTAQLRQLMEGVDDKRRATLSDAASQTKAEPSIAERFRAGATPLRAATTPPPPLRVAEVEGRSSSLSLDEAQFEKCAVVLNYNVVIKSLVTFLQHHEMKFDALSAKRRNQISPSYYWK